MMFTLTTSLSSALPMRFSASLPVNGFFLRTADQLLPPSNAGRGRRTRGPHDFPPIEEEKPGLTQAPSFDGKIPGRLGMAIRSFWPASRNGLAIVGQDRLPTNKPDQKHFSDLARAGSSGRPIFELRAPNTRPQPAFQNSGIQIRRQSNFP